MARVTIAKLREEMAAQDEVISGLRKEIESYREVILHTWAHAMSKVADGAIVAQKAYTPQYIHEMTLKCIDLLAEGKK